MTTEVRISLRITHDLHRWLQAQAKEQERSINRQIVWLLEQARKEGVK